MQKNYKYAMTIPLFAAVFLIAMSAFPAAQHPVNAQMAGMAMSDSVTGHFGKGQTILVHITSGDPSDTHQLHAALMGVQHAKAFQDSGKDVIIFLDVDGVRIADQNAAVQLKDQASILKDFLTSGGRVIACDHCVAMAGVKSLVPGVEIDSHPTMPRLQKILDGNPVTLDY